MECPVCKTEKTIKKSYYMRHGYNFYKVMVFSCRNPTCSEYGKEEEKKIKIDYTED